MSASRLGELTRVLDIGVSYFLDLPDQPGPTDEVRNLMTPVRDRDCLRLISAFERIHCPALRKAILHLVEVFR